MEIQVTDDLKVFGEYELSDYDICPIKIKNSVREILFPQVGTVYANIFGKNEDGYLALSVLGYIGPLQKEDFDYVNYHVKGPETLN